MSGQKPLNQRCQETMELLWKREGFGIVVDRVDKQVLKKLIKTGRAKIINGGQGGWRKSKLATKSTVISSSKLVAIEQPPKKEVKDTGGPGAKKRAALEEMDIHYRGKNLGRPKVVGERKLTRRQKIEKAKKEMWQKLKSD